MAVVDENAVVDDGGRLDALKLALAQQAEALAPDSAAVNQALGQMLDANGRVDQATPYYQKALAIAKTVQPEMQAARITALERRIAAGKPEPRGGRGFGQ